MSNKSCQSPLLDIHPFTDEQLKEELKKHQPGSFDYSSYLAEITQREVDTAVYRASKPHWVDWATFVVAIVACFATVLTFAISVIVYREQLVKFLVPVHGG